ncbi:MAG: hypothetical protein ACUVQ8_00670 [Nitrososphaeria archaeon]
MRLRIKVGGSEIEFEGTLEEMVSAIDSIPKIVEVTHEAERTSSNVTAPDLTREVKQLVGEGGVKGEMMSEPPPIQVSKEDSIADIVVKIMNSPWGRKPRKLDEIRRVLEMLGFPLTRSTAAVTLLRLTKGGKIRRFKDESGEYLYLQLVSAMAEQLPQQSADSSEINKSS